MKLSCIRVSSMSGIATKSGRPYSMSRVVALRSYEPGESGKPGEPGYCKRTGYGSETMEVPVASTFYPTLERHFQQNYRGEPLVLEFTTSIRPAPGNSVETVIEGFDVQPDAKTSTVQFPKTGT